MPEIDSGNKVILFGDFKSYWIADRQGRSFQRLNELYAATGQVGFRTTQRVDGRLVLAEARPWEPSVMGGSLPALEVLSYEL